MNIFCKKISVLLLCGILFGGACSDDAPSGEDSGQQTYSLVVKSITASGEDSFGELREVSVFQFSDGILYRTQLLNPKQDGTSSISALSGSRLYFLSEVQLPVQEESLTEEELCNMAIGEGLHDNSAPDFMSAVVQLENGAETRSNPEVSVAMKRGVARIDLNTTSDDKIRIEEIIVEDAPAETFPFQEGVAVSDKTVKYVKTFEPAFGGEQPNVFHIFESLHPVHIVLRGAYDGIPIRLKMELPDRKSVV